MEPVLSILMFDLLEKLLQEFPSLKDATVFNSLIENNI